MFSVILITIDAAKNKWEGVIRVKCQYGSTAGEFPEERNTDIACHLK